MLMNKAALDDSRRSNLDIECATRIHLNRLLVRIMFFRVAEAGSVHRQVCRFSVVLQRQEARRCKRAHRVGFLLSTILVGERLSIISGLDYRGIEISLISVISGIHLIIVSARSLLERADTTVAMNNGTLDNLAGQTLLEHTDATVLRNNAALGDTATRDLDVCGVQQHEQVARAEHLLFDGTSSSGLSFCTETLPHVAQDIRGGNGGRCTHSLPEHTDVTATDNEALHDSCCRNCDIECPMYSNLNRSLTQFISSFSASRCFNGGLSVDTTVFQTNLVHYRCWVLVQRSWRRSLGTLSCRQGAPNFTTSTVTCSTFPCPRRLRRIPDASKLRVEITGRCLSLDVCRFPARLFNWRTGSGTRPEIHRSSSAVLPLQAHRVT